MVGLTLPANHSNDRRSCWQLHMGQQPSNKLGFDLTISGSLLTTSVVEVTWCCRYLTQATIKINIFCACTIWKKNYCFSGGVLQIWKKSTILKNFKRRVRNIATFSNTPTRLTTPNGKSFNSNTFESRLCSISHVFGNVSLSCERGRMEHVLQALPWSLTQTYFPRGRIPQFTL